VREKLPIRNSKDRFNRGTKRVFEIEVDLVKQRLWRRFGGKRRDKPGLSLLFGASIEC